MTDSRKSAALACLVGIALLAAPMTPCSARDVTITAKQAREYVNGYFGLAAMYAAIAYECNHVPAGRLASRYGSMAWEGDRDIYDMSEKARTYHALRLAMTDKLVAARPSEQADIDASFASAGGEAGLTAAIRKSVTQTESEFEQRGLGKTEACASLKSVVMNTAAQIGEPPDNALIVP